MSLDQNHHSGQGRPRKKKTDKEKQQAMSDWCLDMIDKATSDNRVDALFTSVIRKLKAIPGLLLKLFGCKGDYKSSDLQETLDAYLQCFLEGFVEYFNIKFPEDLAEGSDEEYYLMELFLDFCILKFPGDRVRLLLGMFNSEGSRQFSKFSTKANTIELKRKTSIKSVRKLFLANSAFKLICQEFIRLMPDISSEEKESIQKVIKKFAF
jgi:hypothetical protein